MKCSPLILTALAVVALTSRPAPASGSIDKDSVRSNRQAGAKAATDKSSTRDRSRSSWRGRQQQRAKQSGNRQAIGQIRPPASQRPPGTAAQPVIGPQRGGSAAPGRSKPTITPKNPGRGSQTGPRITPGRSTPVSVRFKCLACREECTTDRASTADEPYFMIGIVDAEGNAKTARSKVFRDVDSGENRPVAGVANELVWQGRVKLPAYFAVILMEHDESDMGDTQRAFQRDLTRVYENFEATDAKYALWENLIPGAVFSHLLNEVTDFSRDEIIGKPQGFMFSKENVDRWQRTRTEYGIGKIRSWAFRGHGADYGLMLQFK